MACNTCGGGKPVPKVGSKTNVTPNVSPGSSTWDAAAKKETSSKPTNTRAESSARLDAYVKPSK
jgi:hypothetical protein